MTIKGSDPEMEVQRENSGLLKDFTSFSYFRFGHWLPRLFLKLAVFLKGLPPIVDAL